MLQYVDATDRVNEELLSIAVLLRRADGTKEKLNEMFLAPTPIVRAFAEFLNSRNEDETFNVKRVPVRFQDITVNCGDSNQAVRAYQCLKHYDMPLSNHKICAELVRPGSEGSMDSSGGDSDDSFCSEVRHWRVDRNFQRFKQWYTNVLIEKDDGMTGG